METTERMKQIAECLKQTREYLGLSQQIVAEYIGIPRASISAIESGKRKVDTLELEKFSKLYKFPISYFLGEDYEDDEPSVQLIARTARELNEKDREQVLKFAQFLRNLNMNSNS
jgi:transcriptional regulator with XRE-family HTH domain